MADNSLRIRTAVRSRVVGWMTVKHSQHCTIEPGRQLPKKTRGRLLRNFNSSACEIKSDDVAAAVFVVVILTEHEAEICCCSMSLCHVFTEQLEKENDSLRLHKSVWQRCEACEPSLSGSIRN